MTNEEAAKHLEHLYGLSAVTPSELAALGIAISELERPAWGKWVKPEDVEPESAVPIMIAVWNGGQYRYYTGQYYAGDWLLENGLPDEFYTVMCREPDYWCYISKPEVPE